MKATAILAALAACSITSAAPNVSNGSLKPRQSAAANDDLATVTRVLEAAREARIESLQRDDDARGRQLGETDCSPKCQQCSNGATVKAVAEIAACGVAALAVDAASLGTTAILEAAGFIACEAAVIGGLDESEANCKGLN